MEKNKILSKTSEIVLLVLIAILSYHVAQDLFVFFGSTATQTMMVGKENIPKETLLHFWMSIGLIFVLVFYPLAEMIFKIKKDIVDCFND